MSIKFNVKLNCEDMYRFNLYHAYTSMQGILSILLSIAIVALLFFTGKYEVFITSAPYVALFLVFVFYIPITLWIRSKRQVRHSEVLQGVLHYELTEEGITVSSDVGDEKATLPWQYVYKAVTTKHNFLIYSNRVNAYVIPKAQVLEQLPEVFEAFEKHCEDYRLRIKR